MHFGKIPFWIIHFERKIQFWKIQGADVGDTLPAVAIFVEVLQQATLATPYRRVGSYMTATAQSHHK